MTNRRGGNRTVRAVLTSTLVAGLLATASATPAGADGNEAPSAPLAFRSITAGRDHTCARLSDGQVKCWGGNEFGQLGIGDADPRGDNPGEMGEDLPAVDLGTGRTAIALSAGWVHTCALLDNGHVKCWGSNEFGQLGQGDKHSRGDGPGEMGNALPAVDLGTGRTAIAVTAGLGHTCALLDNRRIKCWGRNNTGVLGLGNTIDRGDGPGEMGDNLPFVDIGSVTGTPLLANAIGAGGIHNCAYRTNGTVKCWGYGFYGQLGLGNTANRGDQSNEMGNKLPMVTLASTRHHTSAVVPGHHHTCAILLRAPVANRIQCWGRNERGQLGLGNKQNRGDQNNEMGTNLPLVDLGAGRTVAGVSGGLHHTCALLDNARVKCWGGNDVGQLGLGNKQDRGDQNNEMGDSLPALNLGTGRTATAITTGAYHGCAILDDNTLKCWGNNEFGQLGVGHDSHRGDQANEMGDNLLAVDLGGAISPTCDGRPVTVDLTQAQVPTAGNDVILGTPGKDTISGLGGNDRICGGGGNDTIDGGPGNDRIFGQGGKDILKGGPGNDVLQGGNGNDLLSSGAGNDKLLGEAGNDAMRGQAGNDVLNGGPGKDACNGGPGKDTAIGCEIRSKIPRWLLRAPLLTGRR